MTNSSSADMSERWEATITRIIGPNAASAGQVSPVNSHNEWDPLEEVIVGRLEGATIPSGHPVVTCNIPGMAARAQSLVAGFRYPKIMIEPAQRELDGFVALLQSLGVVVTRPEPVDHKKRFSTPEWSSHGFCNSCPRDSMLVIGDEIIETPMVWPCRYFETHSYRPILKDYFRRGARWTAAPRPQLTSELFDAEFRVPEKGQPISYILTEFEPVFDAADFFRCGRDLFVIRSNVTNASGIEWLRRHLGDGYRIHDREPLSQSDAHRYHHIAAWARQDSDQSRIHRRRPSPGHFKKMGHPCSRRARPDHRSYAQDHFAMREMAQHERADSG